MRKILFIIICFFSLCSYSQEHIKFNGATFGQPLNSFIQGFLCKVETNTIARAPKGYNSNISNRNAYWIKLNSQQWSCQVFSSRISGTVYCTVSSISFYSDLKNQLMLLVKTLEGKYGGGVQEKQDELGQIEYVGNYKREMLALRYYVKNSRNQTIGDIRISAAPIDKEGKGGYVELCYTDYKSREKATQEYNTLMNNTF